MRWSFGIGSIAGIRLRIHVTFLLLLVLFPMWAAGSVREAFEVVGVLLSVFACVMLHELGHALAARRYGIGTREIVMLPIGGLARLERMPDKPVQEIVVALAGPFVNVLIASVIALVLALTGGVPDPVSVLANGTDRWLVFLFAANIVMLAFNLVPAFPMDGGRVLRALLAMRLPFERATRIASLVGQGFALVFVAVAILAKMPTLVLVAIFVFMSAAEERAFVQTRTAMSGVPVSAAMLTQFETLETRHTLQRAAGLLVAGSQQDFPVLEDGRLLGMLSRADLVRGLQAEGEEAPVGRVVRLDVEPVDADEPLEGTLHRMRAQSASALPVLSRGQLVGLLTLENVADWLLVREARRQHAGRA